MKIILAVLACLVLVLLAIVVIGLALPKRHTASRAALYKAKAEDLYKLIAGPQSWRPDVVRYEPIADAGGRSLARETTRDGQSVTYELLDAAPPISLKRRIADTNLPFGGTWTFALQSDSESTRVRITEDGEVYNPVFRFVSRFILGHTRTLDSYLQALGTATGEKVHPTD
jgi:hypothetical protein